MLDSMSWFPQPLHKVTAHYARTHLFLVWISVEAASENVGLLQPRYFIIVLTVSNVEHF